VAYTTPLTAISNATLTAAQWNASVRDNLLETAPAKATATGKLIVTTGTNSIAQRTVQTVTVAATETTASTSYVNLTTAGPAVGPLTTGTFAVAFVSGQISQNTNGAFAKMGVTVSGVSSIAASDAQSLNYQPSTAASSGLRATTCIGYEGTLTAGLNTFTAQYAASAGTASFKDRTLTVFAL
jgi:hypothetical protein